MPYRKSSIAKSDHTQSQDSTVTSDEIKVKKEKQSYKDQTEKAKSLSVEDFVGIPLSNQRTLRKTSSKGSSEDDFEYDPLPQGSVGTSSDAGADYKVYRNDGQYQQQIQSVPTEKVVGILDIQPEGHGFLRPKFVPSNRDIYISQSQIRRFSLRPGDEVEGIARPPKDNERYYGLLKVEKVNGILKDKLS